jgi:hypothetical protein
VLCETVDAFITILAYLMIFLPSYLDRFMIEYCLALLRPVAIGDFRSPAIIGGYWNNLAIEWMIS